MSKLTARVHAGRLVLDVAGALVPAEDVLAELDAMLI